MRKQKKEAERREEGSGKGRKVESGDGGRRGNRKEEETGNRDRAREDRKKRGRRANWKGKGRRKTGKREEKGRDNRT